GLPLDGGRLLRAVLCALGARRSTATRVAAWSGRAVAVAAAVSGLVADRTSAGTAAGIFTIGLGAYLWLAATQSLEHAALLEQLPRISVRDIVRPGMFVPVDVSVGEALRRAWDANARGLVLLDASSQPTAIV